MAGRAGPGLIQGHAMTGPSALQRGDTRVLLLRLWREHLREHRPRIVLVLMLTALMSGTTALYPIVIKQAFQMFSDRDPDILTLVPALVIGITALKAAAQYFQNVEVQRIVLLVIRSLQLRMFSHLTHADLARVEREAPAQLTTRFTTDATTIREALTRGVNGIADVVTVVGLVGSMLYLDWLLSLIAAVMYPLAGLPIERIGKRVRRASGGMQERMGEAAVMLNESFAQARTVRAFRLEALETGRADGVFTRLYRSLFGMARTRAGVDPVLEVLGGLAVAAIIAFQGWRASIDEQTLGNFTGFVAALLIASRPLRALGSLNAAVQEGLAGLARIFSVLNEPPTIMDRPDARPLPDGTGHVRFQDVGFRYPDGRVGLAGLTFEALPGRTVALVGPSGAGKSTALALIPRLHDVTSGAVLIDGVDVRDLTLASLRGAIAYVGQDALLFDDTIAANIAMGRPGATRSEVEAAAQAAAAGSFITAMPDGYATRVGTGGQRLSGGQRQRVALARALLRDPRILLLDEATSALDTESAAAVQMALTRPRQGRTTIVIAHRLSTVRDADLVVAMADGRAAEIGTHVDLLAQDGLYARMVRSQNLDKIAN